MARGKAPKPTHLKVVTGNPGRRPIPAASAPVTRESPLKPPKKLTKAQQGLWDRYINSAWWLTEHDTPKAFAWVCLQAEYQRSPANMIAARFTQLRLLGSELGLDPAARARLGATAKPGNDSASAYLDD